MPKHASRPAAASGSGLPAVTFTALFCLFLLTATALRFIPAAIAGVYLVANVITFVAYAVDKSAASRGGRRIRERTLHGLGLIGGWPGALLAQRLCRHKVSKMAFQRGYWVTVACNCIMLGWAISTGAFGTIKSLL